MPWEQIDRDLLLRRRRLRLEKENQQLFDEELYEPQNIDDMVKEGDFTEEIRKVNRYLDKVKRKNKDLAKSYHERKKVREEERAFELENERVLGLETEAKKKKKSWKEIRQEKFLEQQRIAMEERQRELDRPVKLTKSQLLKKAARDKQIRKYETKYENYKVAQRVL